MLSQAAAAAAAAAELLCEVAKVTTNNGQNFWRENFQEQENFY